MESRPIRRKLWTWVAVLLIAVAATAFLVQRSRKKIEIVYRETPAVREDLEVTVLSTGVVQPQNRLEIKPPIAGRVERILIQEGDRVRRGQVIAWVSSTERAAMLDAAQSEGREELKRWEELYRPTPILAPISGTIISRKVEPGQTFTNADAVFVMSDRLTVKAQVDETDIAQIQLGQRTSVLLDAYPGIPILGKAEKIAYDAKTVNNVTTYTVDVLPDEIPREMRSGMTANVVFQISSKPGALVIPSDALRVKNGKFMVLVKNPGGRDPVEKPIKTGLAVGPRTEVLEGLTEGEVVLAAEIKSSGKKEGAKNPFSPFGSGGRKGGQR